MSIDDLLKRATSAPFSVVGVVVATMGIVIGFHSSIQEDAFKYGAGNLISAASLVAYGTVLQHTKRIANK